MTSSARANLGCVVRARESYQGKQGPNYTPGISAESAGSQAIWLGSGTLPPHGGRTKADLHENHETAIYLLSGDEVELWTGEQLEHREVAHPGDYLYIPAGGPMWRSIAARRQPSSSRRGLTQTSRRVWCCGQIWKRRCLSAKRPKCSAVRTSQNPVKAKFAEFLFHALR
jgi:uncharacterized RmlC-like cupin family protein